MGRFKTDLEKVKKRMIRRTQQKLERLAVKKDPNLKAKLEAETPRANPSRFIRKMIMPRKIG